MQSKLIRLLRPLTRALAVLPLLLLGIPAHAIPSARRQQTIADRVVSVRKRIQADFAANTGLEHQAYSLRTLAQWGNWLNWNNWGNWNNWHNFVNWVNL
jgi:hypothetical protein